jgi:polyisoprenoid-binding protein YceI
MAPNRRRLVAVACAVAAPVVSRATQANVEYTVDAAASQVTVQVGRGGLFAFAGHDHEVAVPGIGGTIVLDLSDAGRSTVTLAFDATTMRVTGRGEPVGDVPEVQRVMLSDRVLDVQRHPTIAFVSRRIAVLERAAERLAIRVEGDLTLRGVTRRVIVPVDVRLSADRLTAAGKVGVRQTDFGIRPVTAAAGTVRVQDEVDVVFHVVARR